jgi:transcriptional regulator with XRE-family HTH domain
LFGEQEPTAMSAIVYAMETIRPGRRLARAAADLPAIARRLVAARLAAGMRPIDLAAASGVGRNTLANWETATKRPSVDQLAFVLPVLRVSLDFVFFGDTAALPWDVRARVEKHLDELPAQFPVDISASA